MGGKFTPTERNFASKQALSISKACTLFHLNKIDFSTFCEKFIHLPYYFQTCGYQESGKFKVIFSWLTINLKNLCKLESIVTFSFLIVGGVIRIFKFFPRISICYNAQFVKILKENDPPDYCQPPTPNLTESMQNKKYFVLVQGFLSSFF